MSALTPDRLTFLQNCLFDERITNVCLPSVYLSTNHGDPFKRRGLSVSAIPKAEASLRPWG